MSALINRLTRDHRRFARIMNLLEALLERFHSGEEPDYELMCELLEYVVDYADQVHHPAEELIFARLLVKDEGGELPLAAGQDSESLARSIAELISQHERLARMNRAFRESLEGIVHETVLSREAVEQEGRALVALLREHMDFEEGTLFAVARSALSETDWAALEDAAPSAADPVFGQLDPLRFRALYDHLKDDLDA